MSQPITLEQVWQRLVNLMPTISICEACGEKFDIRGTKVICSNAECVAEMKALTLSDEGKSACVSCGSTEVVEVCPTCKSEDIFPSSMLDHDVLLLTREIGRALDKENPVG